jgi:hypothetical protein
MFVFLALTSTTFELFWLIVNIAMLAFGRDFISAWNHHDCFKSLEEDDVEYGHNPGFDYSGYALNLFAKGLVFYQILLDVCAIFLDLDPFIYLMRQNAVIWNSWWYFMIFSVLRMMMVVLCIWDVIRVVLVILILILFISGVRTLIHTQISFKEQLLGLGQHQAR